MALVLIYVAMGMLTTVVTALIYEVAGSRPEPVHLLLWFLAWPLVLVVLFVKALEVSR